MGEFEFIREPAWITSLADQRAAHLAANVTASQLGFYDVVLMPIAEAPEGADVARWERSCDNCGAFVPVGTDFHCGVVAREVHGKRVMLSYGACQACLEGHSS